MPPALHRFHLPRAGVALLLALLPAFATADTVCPGPVPPAPDGALCAVTANAGPALLLQGMVLQEDGALENGQVLIDGDGTIACVACDCSGTPGHATAVRIECPGGAISPGLIDAMNRLTFGSNPHHVPADPDLRYSHRHQWRTGLDSMPEIPATSNGNTNFLRWAELRSVLAGVTSSISSGGTGGFLRNLTSSADAAAIGQVATDNATFPLGDSDGTVLTGSCAYPNIATPQPGEWRSQVVAEGIDCRARNEFLCLSGQQAGAVDAIPDSTLEQGIALATDDLALLRDGGGVLTWHPRTQVSLYGTSAPVLEALALGLPVAIGSNWTPTGSMHLGRELACARSLDQAQFGQRIGDRALWRMATAGGAQAAGMAGAIGTLAPGAVGDVVVVDRHAGDGYTAVVTAGATDIALVLRGGVALYGEATVLEALGATDADCDALDVCGSPRRACVGRETAGTLSFATLAGLIGGDSPPAYFCSPPAAEPTCTPARSVPFAYPGAPASGDADGDGIGDAADNCPAVFNPLRPIDAGVCPAGTLVLDAESFPQPDADADGIGDPCDRCPLDPGEDACLASLDLFADGFEAPVP